MIWSLGQPGQLGFAPEFQIGALSGCLWQLEKEAGKSLLFSRNTIAATVFSVPIYFIELSWISMNFLIHYQFISILSFWSPEQWFVSGNFLIQPPPNHSKASFRAAKSHIAFSRTACCSVPWVVKTSSCPKFLSMVLKLSQGYQLLQYIKYIKSYYTSYHQIDILFSIRVRYIDGISFIFRLH